MTQRRRGLTFVEGVFGAVLLWGSIVLIIGVGWAINIVELSKMSFDPLTGLAVLRVIGVFIPPLGAVLGYFV